MTKSPRFFWGRGLLLRSFLVFAVLCSLSGTAMAETLVSSLSVEGTEHVVPEHVLAAVRTKVGEPLDRAQLQKDVEAIYGLGFFSFVDVDLKSLAGGAAVTFIVKENPVVERIDFKGNTVYTGEQLNKLVFTVPGNVFNQVFFRHDLERIQEHYRKDGYTMVKIADVQINGGVISVSILEPKVGDIIIQGNKRTKTFVIQRELKLKSGDLFNSTRLRHSLGRLQGMGYFEDVNVGFEPGDDPSVLNLVLTVVEKKTGHFGFSVSHGSESGWSGGLDYTDTNWRGLGHNVNLGFETGDNERYWITYTQPFMDEKTYAWKAGIYKQYYDDVNYYRKGLKQLEYDENKKGVFFGAGKKFRHDSKLSWFVTLEWKDVEVSDKKYQTGITSDDLDSGTTFSVVGTLTRNNLDEYLSYPKGDVIDLSLEQAFDFLGGDYNYTKYWIQGRYYLPIPGITEYFGGTSLITEDNPAIFAARVKAGFSSGELPTAGRYSIGGASTLRGYDGGQFEGDDMFLANLELRIPVDKTFNFVVFYDTGNAWGSDGSYSLSDLYDSWGFGVRVRTPIGNIRFDIAEGEFESRTHFGFGEMF